MTHVCVSDLSFICRLPPALQPPGNQFHILPFLQGIFVQTHIQDSSTTISFFAYIWNAPTFLVLSPHFSSLLPPQASLSHLFDPAPPPPLLCQVMPLNPFLLCTPLEMYFTRRLAILLMVCFTSFRVFDDLFNLMANYLIPKSTVVVNVQSPRLILNDCSFTRQQKRY